MPRTSPVLLTSILSILAAVDPSALECGLTSGRVAMAYVRAEELSYTKVRALDTSRTICFQPVSALEVHGPHLPLGMDLFMARWMAEETGRRFADAHPDWTVVQQPPLPL